MPTIRLKDMRPGMVLGANVKDINGRILLTAGTELSERHITIFKAWGVFEVDVKAETGADANAAADSDVDPESYALAEENTRELFRYANVEQPPMKEIMRLCLQHRLRNKS